MVSNGIIAGIKVSLRVPAFEATNKINAMLRDCRFMIRAIAQNELCMSIVRGRH